MWQWLQTRLIDRRTWWETKGQLSLGGYCRPSPLVSSLTLQPAHYLLPLRITVHNSNSVFKYRLFVKVCVWEKGRETAGRGKQRVFLFDSLCQCMHVSTRVCWDCTVWVCVCVCLYLSDVKDPHCVRGETLPPFTKRSLSSWLFTVLRENLKR